jgi:hypothetical protein
MVTDAILFAAEHEVRDYVVSDVAKLLDVAQKISPALVDALLLAMGFPLQQIKDPKSEEPNNLYEPVQGYDRVEGDFGKLEIPSVLDHLDKNAGLAVGAIAAAIDGLALLTGFGNKQ